MTKTKKRYYVANKASGEQVVGPLDKKPDATSEKDRLNKEAKAGGHLHLGEEVEYEVQTEEVPV